MSVEQQAAGGFGVKASMNGATETFQMDHDIGAKLREVLRTTGVGPIELIADGQVHRFDSPSDKCGRKSGWYVLYDTGVAVLGSWKDDITHQVIAPNGNGNGNGRITKADRERIEEAKLKAAEERKRGQAEVAVFARKLWETAQPVRDQREHPYLVQKNIQPHGVRMRNGNLCIPMRDVQSQKIVNLQVIRRNGAKRFLPGSQAANCYFPINDQGAAHAVQLYIAEGFATAATVHEATRVPTTTAFNAGNLLAVTKALHERYPTAQIVVCADDDREMKGNPGLTKGTEAARAVSGLLAVPKFNDPTDRTDFNDLAHEQSLDTVREQIGSAIPPSTKAKNRADEIPAGFRLTKDTLYGSREIKIKGEVQTEEFPICSHLEIVALTRDANGEEWGRLTEFKDPDGHIHSWSMPTALLAGDGNEYRGRLLEQGLNIWPGRNAKDGLHEYLTRCRPTARARAVTHVGWHSDVFVLPDATFSAEAETEKTIYQSAASIAHHFAVRGTLESWRGEIAARCVGNSRLTFGLSAAFAAALLNLTGDESGGFHIVGASSLGKTTLLRVAGSTWGGGPSGYLRQWRATANGLEGVAALHSDSLLVLDELAQIGAREAGEAAYLLANGQGKSRARRDGSARVPLTWRTLFLSSGEVGLADKIREDGRQRATAGQQVRVLDIPADTGKFGLFENLHGAESGQEFADILRAATQRNYGTAARAFLSEIVKETQRIADPIRHAQGEFVSRNLPAGATEQVGRAAMRFGLVAAAGELAAAFAIPGWSFGTATEAASACFAAWLDRRGHFGPVEIESGIEQVRHFFALHGASRFGASGASDVDAHGRAVFNRAGFRKTDGAYCIYPTVFRSEISAGYDLRSLADALAARGLLRCDGAGRAHVPTPVKNPDNNTTIRMFVFEPSIVGEEVAE